MSGSIAGPAVHSPAVHVIGASGRSGAALCRALAAAGRAFVPVVRDRRRWAAVGLDTPPRLADLGDPASLAGALGAAAVVVSCAHARHVPAILRAAPAAGRFVFLGSTRRFSRWPDAHGGGVQRGEQAFLASGRPGVMLHPTMIYGAQGEDNVQRLARLLGRLPLVPLPGGGRALVQPIHQSDVTAALLAALHHPWAAPASLVIAGPAPLAYRDFVRAVAKAAGRRPPRIVAVPVTALRALAPLLHLLPGPRVTGAELRRLTEDKAFDITPARAQLGFDPLSLDEGLRRTFPPPPALPLS